MIVYRLPGLLTVEAWEMCLGGAGSPFVGGHRWRPEVAAEGFRLDFASVEFVHFETLARALVLLDAAVRDGVQATVVLPTGVLPVAAEEIGESAEDGTALERLGRRTARQAKAREDARAFMRDVGFLDALRASHWDDDAVRVEDSAAPRSGLPWPETQAGPVAAALDEPKLLRRRRILPFRWVSVDAHGPVASEVLPEVLRRFTDMGLSRSDARAITHVVVSGLAENVGLHASSGSPRTTRALIAAVLVDDDVYVGRCRLPRSERGLADSLEAGGFGGQVLQVVVGDSGVGLLHRLSPDADPARAQVPPRELVLQAFERNLASRGTGARAEAVGLWRVARLVGSYHGSVVTRSASAAIGKVYTGAAVEDFDQRQPAWAPGTVVEVTLVIRDYLTRALSVPWEWRSSARADARWEVIPCEFDPEHGIGDADRARLDEAALLAQEGRRSAGVVATIPVRQPDHALSDTAVQTALSQALHVASLTPHQATVVLVFPNADPRLLDLLVAGLNADEEREWELTQRSRTPNPILVLGASGAPFWCGGSACLRVVLEGLTAAGGALPVPEVTRLWAEAGRAQDELWPILAKHAHLITVTSGEVILHVSAGDAVRALGEYVRDGLAEAIEQSGPGVSRGLFRTPMLRLTSRWIDVERLVNGTIGLDLVTFLLARAVEEASLAATDHDRSLVVARASTTPAQLAAQLSECLYRDGRYYELPGDLDLDGIPVSEQVPRRANVVICADMLSTENTVRRAAAALAGKCVVPVAVVCVVDARTHSGPIRMFNRDIAVLSLVKADTTVPSQPEGTPVDINPIHRRPVAPHEVPTPARTPITEETLLEWCAEDDDALRLGHVESIPRARHFSAYPQLDHLLFGNGVSDEVCAAIRYSVHDVMLQWDVDSPGVRDPLASCRIWYPAGTADYASKLAQLVRKVLVEEGAEVTDVSAIPRAVAGNRWTFPASLPAPPEARNGSRRRLGRAECHVGPPDDAARRRGRCVRDLGACPARPAGRPGVRRVARGQRLACPPGRKGGARSTRRSAVPRDEQPGASRSSRLRALRDEGCLRGVRRIGAACLAWSRQTAAGADAGADAERDLRRSSGRRLQGAHPGRGDVRLPALEGPAPAGARGHRRTAGGVGPDRRPGRRRRRGGAEDQVDQGQPPASHGGRADLAEASAVALRRRT
ncbi:hypothetical protein [Amycolatopsis nalaikhensis]|uniref:Uncharacterized protein n=1 Tax=Amycolatopsis nalaikhensis TaxID=715472 RepID=A0ABY8XJ86_9PSEU|nr:hypothetical protein [Amycolatopsis sp. 2-2]WIV55658.1 hypothetical protein QP939_43750 [Amycolatopsis sp. 2-2]